MKITSKRLTALALVLALLLASCAGETSATTMYLRKTEGTVDVSDGEGKDITPKDDLGLYSGYQVGTQAESYAWIDLDKVKLTKLDQDSEVEINKEGKKLEINVKSGSLFFNVTEPLADDEIMNIATSTMMIGVRGTCGWVTGNTAALLEGTVSVTAGGQEATINAGEMAVLTEDGKLEVKPLTLASIPAFVRDEVAEDEKLSADIQDTTGMDLTGADPMAGYADFLAKIEKGGKILYTEIIDLEQDGNPELLAIYTEGQNEATDTDIVVLSFVRKGSDGISRLYHGRSPWNAGEFMQINKYSLVEYDGRLYLEEYSTHYRQDSYGEAWQYYFSTAEEDGAEENWHRMYVSCSNSGGGVYYWSYGNTEGNENGPNDISAGEYEDIHGQFNTVRVLAYIYTSDGKNETVTSNQSEIEEILQSMESA